MSGPQSELEDASHIKVESRIPLGNISFIQTSESLGGSFSLPSASDIRHTPFNPILIRLHKLRMYGVLRRVIFPICFICKYHDECMCIPIRITYFRTHVRTHDHGHDVWFAGDGVETAIFERQHGGWEVDISEGMRWAWKV